MSFSLKYILSLFALILISLAFQYAHAAPLKGTMPRNVRQLSLVDVDETIKIISKKINANEKDNDVFLNQVARVLAETVLVNPTTSAREAGISHVKTLMPPEDFPEAMDRASKILLPLAKSSNPVDQATAMVGLVNLVVESKRMAKSEMKETLQTIASANLEISEEARDYGLEPLKNMVSPSEEAKAILN